MIVRNKDKRRKRRKSVSKLIVINEEELIRQVSIRPVMYDRSLKPYRKHSLRQQCWKEISETMDAAVEECRKRWRSLRDTFVKHHRQVQGTTDQNIINKHRKWVFYDKMSFLIPHLDGVNNFDYDIVDEFGDNSDDAKSVSCKSIVLSPSVQDVKNLEEHHVEGEVNVLQISPSVTTSSFAPIPNSNNDAKNDASKEVTSSLQCPSQGIKSNASIVSVQSAETNTINNNAILMESDEKFLLSCAPALRRLTTRQNALARLKIQQILFEIEFEEQYN